MYRGGGGVRGGIRVAPRFGSSRGFIRSGFYRPYYAFRPRLSLGFGLWAGYPVAYPYYSDYPYGYGAPYQSDPYAYGGYNNGASSSSYAYEVQPYGRSAQRPAYPESDDRFDNDEQQPSASGVQRRGDDRSAAGGISFEITPDAAAVFVDGTYVGTAGTFGPSSQPLGLTTGRHHVEIRASGYRSMTFDADVTPGQVIPYQGTLQRN